jgi:ABC-type antimicrobial peptide transport system permease subunit
VNQAFADRYLGGANPVGKTIVRSKPQQIVGVTANARTWGLDEIEPTIYSPITVAVLPRVILRNTPANTAAVEAVAKNLDAKVQVRLTPLTQNLNRWLSTFRIGASVAGMLGVLALALASIGIAGVFAYSVQQRTREIGIRVALGARPVQVIRTVAGSAARSLAGGLVVGLVVATVASRMIRQYLFGLNRLDPLTYTAVLAVLAAAGIAATWLPLRRALTLDANQALRHE